MINRELLKSLSMDIGIQLDEIALNNFDKFAEALVETNKVMNLTAITEPDEIVVKHFVDSLELLRYVDMPKDASLIDVGCGAGFPGIPIQIARPDLRISLIDSLKKRIDFVNKVIDDCSLDAVAWQSRAEDAAHYALNREDFDFATARAVAPLNILAEYCLPFVKVGGYFIALKGSEDETEASKNAITLLGGKIEQNVSYKLPNGDPRTIVIIKKISQTPTKYPRKPKKIAASPLG